MKTQRERLQDLANIFNTKAQRFKKEKICSEDELIIMVEIVSETLNRLSTLDEKKEGYIKLEQDIVLLLKQMFDEVEANKNGKL